MNGVPDERIRYGLTLRLPQDTDHRIHVVTTCVRDLLAYAANQPDPIAWDTLHVEIVTTPDELGPVVRSRVDVAP